MCPEVKAATKVEFWCFSSLPLTELFGASRLAFPSRDADFTHDAENVWEWFNGITTDHKIGFNISRPHEDCAWDGNETVSAGAPIRFSLSLIDPTIKPGGIGNTLADVLGIAVHRGDVIYLGGDEFEYRIAETFRP